LGLLCALIYILFVLPEKAAAHANECIQTRMADYNAQLVEASSKALLEAGKAQAQIGSAVARTKAVDVTLAALNESLKTMQASDPARLSVVIKDLQDAEGFTQNLQIISAVRSLENRLSAANKPVAMIGYENSFWKNSVQRSQCNTGEIVVGIAIDYGGPCNNQCNDDDGVVKSAKILCWPL
jgi:hypothetical protein